jgi:hypothetical protein
LCERFDACVFSLVADVNFPSLLVGWEDHWPFSNERVGIVFRAFPVALGTGSEAFLTCSAISKDDFSTTSRAAKAERVRSDYIVEGALR